MNEEKKEQVKHCERDWAVEVTSKTGQVYNFAPCEVTFDKPGTLFYDVELQNGDVKRFCHACLTQFDLDAKQIVTACVVKKDGKLKISPNTREGVAAWKKTILDEQKRRQDLVKEHGNEGAKEILKAEQKAFDKASKDALALAAKEREEKEKADKESRTG